MHLNIRVAWASGQWVNSLWNMIANIFAWFGYKTVGDRQYQSLIKWWINYYDIVIDSESINISEKVDIILALNLENAQYYALSNPDALIIINNKYIEKLEISLEKSKKQEIIWIDVEWKYDNIYLFGVLWKILNININKLNTEIENIFKRKGETVVNYNKKVVSGIYNKDLVSDKELPNIIQNADSLEMRSGNSMIAEWAYKGGLTFYTAYPMTPASSLLSYCAQYPEIQVIQPEDEIAVWMSMLWASYAGARSMCWTSWDWFDLMTTTISFSEIAEIWWVYILSSRAGPSTWTPTFTEFSDIEFARNPSYAWVNNITLAPSSFEEWYTMIVDALNHADVFQCPVIFLIDKNLSETQVSVEISKPQIKINRWKLITEYSENIEELKDNSYLRYKYTEDSISPRTIPWVKNWDFITTSYEHSESWETTELSEIKVKNTHKRFDKLDNFFEKVWFKWYEIINSKAKKLFVTIWFSSYAVKDFIRNNKDYWVIIIKYIKPFDKNIVQELENIEELIFVEQNHSGQLENLFISEVNKENKKVLDWTKISNYRKYDLYPYTREWFEKRFR